MNGGVCYTHGAKKVVHYCNVEGCKNIRVQGGVCKKHGAVTSQTSAAVKKKKKKKSEEEVEEDNDGDEDFEAITNAIGEATKASMNSGGGGQVKSVAV